MKTKSMIPTGAPVWLVAILVCFIIGCKTKGLDVQMVEGVVTLDGDPFPGVTVTLYPANSGNMGYAVTNSDGYYQISTLGGRPMGGAMIGKYRIGMNKIIEYEDRRRPEDLVPLKYRNPDSSDIEISVEKGKNVFNFDLKSK